MGLQKPHKCGAVPPILITPFILARTTVMTDSLSQKKNINYLKAFAIIMVVFYHAVCDILCASNPDDLFAAGGKTVMENVHVPLFFLIAGYLCHKQNIKNFYIKKIQRILIPFLFMSCLKLIFNNLISSAHIHGNDLLYQLFDAFVCGRLYWFCYALLAVYAAAPLFWNNKLRMWVVLIVSLTANIILDINGIELTYVLQIENVIYQLPFFITGMLLAQYNMLCKPISAAMKSVSSLLSLMIAMIMMYMEFMKGINNYIINFIMGISIMYVLFNIAVSLKGAVPDKIFTLPARYSLQIMFLDSFYRMLMILVLSKFMNYDICMVLMVSILVVVLSCFTCRLLEKVPVIKILLGLKIGNS